MNTTIVGSFVDVWQQVLTFLGTTWETIQTFFYAEGSLTFAGTIAVFLGGISLILLVFNIIRSFFSFHA